MNRAWKSLIVLLVGLVFLAYGLGRGSSGLWAIGMTLFFGALIEGIYHFLFARDR